MEYAPFVERGDAGRPWVSRPLLMAQEGWDDASLHNHTSPAHFAQRERALASLGPETEHAVAVDAFTWALGPGPSRATTQVGGSPYWPVDKPWPQFDGQPGTFLAQLNFADSRDLLPDLPGEILCLFVKDEDFYADEAFQAFWLPAGLEDLVEVGNHPQATFPLLYAHGIRFRTVDDLGKRDRYSDPEDESEDAEVAFEAAIIAGTKIGGAIWDPQDYAPEVADGETFLGSLCSIQGAPECPWPWANQEAPMGAGFDPGEMHDDRRNLMLGDMGNINLFLQANGELRFGGSCF